METVGNQIKNIQAGDIPGFGPAKFMVSSLCDYDAPEKSSPLSIKIVLDGTEEYTVGKQHYKVNTGKYFIVNPAEEIAIHVDSKQATKGVCIYPPQDLFQGTFEQMTVGTDEILSHDIAKTSFNFTHKITDINHSKTGQFLRDKLPVYLNQPSLSSEILTDFYSDLSVVMIRDQMDTNLALSKLKSTRKATREELYRRLSRSRDYMEENKTKKIELDTLAELSCLSKYHFLRCFKDLFGMSPYQYVIMLKLDLANSYRQKGVGYAEINELVGFSDPKNLKRALDKYLRRN
jgi:AraC-like DNA-binding protein